MEVLTLLLALGIAVTAMRLFSAALSLICKQELREPELLSRVLNKLISEERPDNGQYLTLAWILHLAIGVIFLEIFELLWILFKVEQNFLWTLIFATGLAGLSILGWKLMFGLVHYRSNFHYASFFVHLFFAHIIFFVSALLVNNGF